MTATNDELLLLLEALWQIAAESEEAETVKIAITALTNTRVGMEYLKRKPLRT